MIKNLVKSLLKSFGFQIIYLPNSRDVLPGRLKQIIKKLEIDTVIDVGANNGQFLNLLTQIGFQGDVCSFEPIPELHQRIQTLYQNKKNWLQFPYACGATDGTAIINISESSDFSSILKPNKFCLSENPTSRSVRTQAIEVKRLDSFLRGVYSNFLQRKILLKIDTQGYDQEVFEGAREILNSIKAVQVEIPAITLYQESLTMPQTLDVYLSSGFSVSGSFPVSYSKDGLFVVEYDYLFVKRSGEENLAKENEKAGKI
jgi:FkbM family methyltransferase